MKTCNGHRSWNAWNVSLWIGNDEPMYRLALASLARANNNAGKAARYFMALMQGQKTPDGAIYNHLSVKLCLQNFMND